MRRRRRRAASHTTDEENTMQAFMTTAATALFAIALAGCGKVDPQLTADQMTMTDATCAPAEVDRIADADVRKAFAERCARRAQAQQPGR
jgi:entry exclusion lipoprotein TrbK